MSTTVPERHRTGASFEHGRGTPVDGAWVGTFDLETDSIRVFGLAGTITHNVADDRYYGVAGWPYSRLDAALVVASAPTARECHGELDAGGREVLRIMDRAAHSVDVLPGDRPGIGDLYRGGRVLRARLDEVGRTPKAWVFLPPGATDTHA